MLKRLLGFIRSERGSVEAAMVTIPLLFLFLIGMQLALSAHSRNIERFAAQNDASVRAISGDFNEGDGFASINGGLGRSEIDLLITSRSRKLESLLPTLGFLDQRYLDVKGLAIIENQR